MADGGGQDETEDLDGIGYAEALRELEDILGELEGDAVDIDRLAQQVQRATALITLCRTRIVAARADIEAAVAGLDRPESPTA